MEEYGEMDELSNDFFDITLFFLKFVLITPGSIITTLMPNGSNSYDIDSLRPSKANLLLTYADIPGKPIRPAPELIFTIVPDFFFLIIGRTCCVSRITPNKLVSNCDLISSTDKSSKAPTRPYPALFTSTSILSFSDSTFSIESLIEASSFTSS